MRRASASASASAALALTTQFLSLAGAQTVPPPVAPPPAAAPAQPAWPQAQPSPPTPAAPQPMAPALNAVPPSNYAEPPPPPPPQEDEEEDHAGGFGRADVGLGYGWVGNGDLAVEPGFKPVDNLDFSGPVVGVSAQGGAGFSNFALAGEFVYERMLARLEQPSNVSFQLFGVGIGAAYYLPDDFHVGAQLRYVGLLLWRREIPCFWDRGDWSWGPGVGATLGKEWFGDDDTGIGFAVQGNYAALVGRPNLRYASVLGKFSITGF